MIPAQELLLVLAALGLYAADATRFLFADELVLEQSGRRWRVRDGLQTLFAGRRPMVPDLLRPGRPLLLVSVDRLGQDGAKPALDGRHFLAALRPFGWRATVLLLLFFPGLPLVLRGFGTGVELLAWLVVVYAVVGSMAWQAWRYRRVLGLKRRGWLALVLECALCPPFAINIVRKLAPRADFVGMGNARRVLGPEGEMQLHQAATHRIDEMLAYLAPDAPKAGRLAEQRLRLSQGQTP